MIKRLQKELLHLKDTTLTETGIFYFVEDTLSKATAFMFGPKDTPYEFCPLEFSFSISDDYPFQPPTVLYRTNDGKTRFHPNFYVDGKVCLSILGTYSGPKWASSMNISTILLSIYSLLTHNPLSSEPAYETTILTNPKNKEYADYVEYRLAKLFIEQYNNNYYMKFSNNNEDFRICLEKKYHAIKEKIRDKSSIEKKFTTFHLRH